MRSVSSHFLILLIVDPQGFGIERAEREQVEQECLERERLELVERERNKQEQMEQERNE